jgi:ribose transport system substrate-binding protein
MKACFKFFCVMCFVLLFASTLVFAGSEEKEGKGEVVLATVIRTIDNPYHVRWNTGGEEFAKSIGYPHELVTCGGSSEKQNNDIKALVARTGGNVVFNIDPNESPDCVPIAKALEDAGVYFFTWWNKPPELNVLDYPHWVGHSAFSGVDAGYYGATELFKTFKTPNKGKIVAIQGRLANQIAIDLFDGLKKALAENRGVKLVAEQSAHWKRTEAFEIVSSMIVAHPDIDGVWLANDHMAMGAIEALRAAGLAGKVKVCGFNGNPEFIDAIIKGEAAATTFTDSYYQGGIGLSLCLAAKEGKIDVESLPKEKRVWYSKPVYVNAENAEQVKAEYMDNLPEYDWNDWFGLWAGGMD